jgi:hypothetical protein
MQNQWGADAGTGGVARGVETERLGLRAAGEGWTSALGCAVADAKWAIRQVKLGGDLT